MTSIGDLSGGSPERFGYSWARYSGILSEHEEQFRRWTVALERQDWQGKMFLDVGCGIGRNSYWPMCYGAAGGLAIDLDDRTLAAAMKNLADFPSLHVAKQSAYDIDVENQFDIAFSIGVIHHLEFPEKAISKMVRAVKPGGQVLIWLYGYEHNEWIVRFADPLRKTLFSRLPLGVVHGLSLFPTTVLYGLVRLNVIRIEYFRLLRRLSFPHMRAIVFDQMLPRIARYYRKDEAIRLLTGAGLVEVQAHWVNGISWCVMGRKADFQHA